jgi:hypothetical protein
MDIIFAPNDKFLMKHPMADELLKVLRTLPTTKRSFHTARGFITGNLKKMQQWEQKKAAHNELREAVASAKAIKQEVWDAKFVAWDEKKSTKADEFKIIFDEHYQTAKNINTDDDLENWRDKLNSLNAEYREAMEALRAEKSDLSNEYSKWKELTSKKGQMPLYPPTEGMPNVNSSAIGKFSYDTVLSCDLVHVARMFIELLSTGTIQNSRAYESEMYAVRHGKYKTFQEFEEFMNTLVAELEEANKDSKLGNHNYEELQNFLIDFINQYHKQL